MYQWISRFKNVGVNLLIGHAVRSSYRCNSAGQGLVPETQSSIRYNELGSPAYQWIDGREKVICSE